MPTTVQRSDDNTRPLEQENRRLRQALEEMVVLEQIAAATSSDQPPDAIIELIVEKSVKCLAVEQAAVHLLDEGPGERPLRTLMRRAGTRAASTSHALGNQISGWMLKHQQPLRINDPGADPRLRIPASPDAPIRSLLSVPVRSKGKLLGVLSLFNKKSDEGFTAEDERVLSIVAAHSVQVLQSAKHIGELRHDRDQLANENTQLWREVNRQFNTDNVIGSATNLRKVLRLIEQIRDTSVDVLITGESDTGKELIAKTIHYTSPRARKPFVALNCAALPDTLLEAELFGIEKGVATGVEKRMGQFEAAHGGTLFLDEIGDLSLTAQAKILRVLQERVVQRLGARGEQRIDVRVLAATNKDLETAIKEEKFREDLLYRLNVIHIELPPLREIREDIPELANAFLARVCREMNKPAMTFSPDAIASLMAAPWPGNIRQLQNEVKRAAICAAENAISAADLSERIRGPGAAGPPSASESPGASGDEAACTSDSPLDNAMDAYEKRLLFDALRQHGGNQVQTAKSLGLSRQGLIKKMKRHGISSSDVRSAGS